MAATSVCLVIWQYRSNKLQRKFWINFFCLSCPLNYQYNVIWRIKIQIVHSNLYFSSVFTFSVNNVEYRNIWQYAMLCDVIVLWPMYHDAYHVVKSLPTPSPNFRIRHVLLSICSLFVVQVILTDDTEADFCCMHVNSQCGEHKMWNPLAKTVSWNTHYCLMTLWLFKIYLHSHAEIYSYRSAKNVSRLKKSC